MSVEYYFSGTYKKARVFQEFNVGTLEGKTVQVRLRVDDMYLSNHIGAFYVYMKVDSGSTSKNYNVEVNLPFNSKNHLFALQGLTLTSEWTMLKITGYTGGTFTVPIVGNALETIVAEITVKHKVPLVTPAVYVTDIETTATFSELSSIDYSAPTVSFGTPDPSTDDWHVTIPNIAASQAVGVKSLRIESELEGEEGFVQSYEYLLKDDTTTTSYTKASHWFAHSFLWGEREINRPYPNATPGKTVTLRLICYSQNGLSTTVTKTFVLPAYVESISHERLGSLDVGGTLQLAPVLNTYNNLAPKISGVTYSSNNTSIATVDSSGLVTAVSEGACQITITSQDTRDNLETWTPASITLALVVGDGAFPTFSDEYDTLYVGLMNDINYALEILADEYSVTLTENTYYNEYYTWLKNMKPCLDIVNSNVKAICTAAGVSHTLPSEWPYENEDGVWSDIVNEWIDLIEQIHNL